MKRMIKPVLLLALLPLAPAAFAQLRAKPDCNQPPATQISATVYAKFDYNFEGVGAWVGYALISFGDKPARAADLVDRNVTFYQRKNGAVYGTEIVSLSLKDGSGTFKIFSTFTGTPAATPGLYTLHETGTIGGGTGEYARASGYVTVQGPFLFADPSVTEGDPVWISEVHGSVLGINER